MANKQQKPKIKKFVYDFLDENDKKEMIKFEGYDSGNNPIVKYKPHGGGWIDLTDQYEYEDPNEPPVHDSEVEFHTGSRWVKIGGRWYKIG